MNQAVRQAVHHAITGNGHDTRGILCSRGSCINIAEFRIGATVWARGAEHLSTNGLDLKFPLAVCRSCKEKTEVANLVDNKGWRQIVQAVRARGAADPDRTSITLTFERLFEGAV